MSSSHIMGSYPISICRGQTCSENKELRDSGRLEGHAIPQPLNPPCELVDEVVAPTCVNVMGPQLPIRVLAREQMEGPDHERMGHGDDGAFLPPTGGQALRQGRQRGPLGVGCRMGQRGQAWAQGLVAHAGLPRALRAGTLIVARCDATPGRHAGGRAKAPPVDPHSATGSSPPRWLTPGIVSRRATAWAKAIGAPVASDVVALPASPGGPGGLRGGSPPLRVVRRHVISALRASICSSSKSMWASCMASHCR
jgi:hypothetical protein